MIKSSTLRVNIAQNLLEQCASGWDSVAVKRDSLFLRCEVPIPGPDPLDWLESQTGFPRIYWSERNGDFEAACLGAADSFTSDTPVNSGSVMHALSQRISLSKGVNYYGHLCFDQEYHRGPEWSGFGAFRFTLPRFELYRSGNAINLAFHAAVIPGMSRDVFLENCRKALLSFKSTTSAPTYLCGGKVLPVARREFTRWQAAVNAALQDIATGSLEKAVLARTQRIQFDIAPNPMAFIRCFHQMKSPAYFFSFQYNQESAFFGSSPEQLFRRENGILASEALAGTRPRGKTPSQDKALCQSLISSQKDRLEHQLVEAHISRNFKTLCEVYEVPDEPEILQLVKVQHLIKRIRGKLKPGMTDADILSALQPTPAVAGIPVSTAMARIRALEGFDRGLYSGPVGRAGKDVAEFAVAIRSGLLSGKRLTLFSGAGIVPGSVAEMEWAETENKFGHFTQVIGL